jgi:alpha-glucosidase
MGRVNPTPRPAAPPDDVSWWRRGAIYQVYPRSFNDADGDGIGDLEGLRRRLPYIASLGAEAIWLSPVFPSPMADFGYDVSDYCDIDPVFGSLADFDRLVAEAHGEGLKVVLDWVANHTSVEHPWFVESRASRDSAKRDWYVWADPADDGGPPNDWVSAFSAVGSAWTLDQETGQFYLHSFAPEQPDLNWDNPEVEEAMHDTARFWLDRGVDGLRLDAIIKVAKDPLLRDSREADRPRHEDWEDTIGPRLARLRQVLEGYPDRMMVGELWAHDLPRFLTFLRGDGMHLAHNFEFVELPWDADRYRAFVGDFARLSTGIEQAWPCWFLENHDLPRVASRFDDTRQGAARARAVVLMLYALRGTPFLYQGQELGLPDAEVPPDRVVDVDGRDPQRSPMPWLRPSRAGAGAGFTTGTPWLPMVADAERLCVEAQEEDPGSTLQLTRRIADLRRHSPALHRGSERLVDAGPDILAWVREDGTDRVLVLINFADAPRAVSVPSGVAPAGTTILSTWPGRPGGETDLASLDLAAAEGVLLQL